MEYYVRVELGTFGLSKPGVSNTPATNPFCMAQSKTIFLTVIFLKLINFPFPLCTLATAATLTP